MFYSSKDIMTADEPEASMSCVFMYIHLANQKDKKFTLSLEAETEFCRYFDQFRAIVKQAYRLDTFIS